MKKPNRKFDFGGYATKNNLKCADGRIIRKDAFKENDGQTVPLMYQHLHNDPLSILGHAFLENREDGVYAYCSFNDTDAGKNAKIAVEHGDIISLSIHANQLKQQGTNVIHGMIREVSLVLAGANPGAMIDNLQFDHRDGTYDTDVEEAIIYTGLNISLTDLAHSNMSNDSTVEEIFNSMSPEQQQVVYAMVTNALEEGAPEGNVAGGNNMNHSAKGGKATMKKNVFEKKEDTKPVNTLTHAQFAVILADALKMGTFKESVLSHAVEYGIEDVDVLFPDARSLSRDPDWRKREDGWVPEVLGGIHKSPFSRVKSTIMDMDFATARAKGYVKGSEKKEVFMKASKRVTTPTTVYVKQAMDHDDIKDIVDYDAVAMINMQLRTLLDEELAVAALIGDGRESDDQYKINEENIRPIWTDDSLYSEKELLTTNTDYAAMVEEIALSGERYKGSGSPNLYTTNRHHMKMLWIKDANGRRIYESDATLCAAMGVNKIVEVPPMVNKTRTDSDGNTIELIAIKINLKDYNFGADKGGEVESFEGFDIDFNKHKYLKETRVSGALTKPKSAQIYEFERAAG